MFFIEKSIQKDFDDLCHCESQIYVHFDNLGESQ